MVKVVLHVDLFAVQIQQRQLIEANLFHETANSMNSVFPDKKGALRPSAPFKYLMKFG
jgi:hypothetical protein